MGDFPDLITPTQAIAQDLAIHDMVWDDLLPRLQACRVTRFQFYSAWMRQRGREWSTLGPTPLASEERAKIFSGLSGQRFPADSSKGLDHLLPPGLGKESHIRSTELPSPFQPKVWPEPDVEYVVDALGVWQEYLPQFAAEQRRIVEALALAVAPLEKHLDAVRCPSSKQVAAMKRPAFVAFMTAFLRWPDRAQARHMVIGYNIVGEFGSTGLFRQLPLDEVPTLQQWLGPSAIEAVDSLLRRGPPRFHEDIFSASQKKSRPQVFVAFPQPCRR